MLRSQEGMVLKCGQLIENGIRKMFMEKYAESKHQKLVPDQYSIW